MTGRPQLRRASAEKVVRSPRSVGRTRQVFPRYVAIGNAKKVALKLDVCDEVPEHYRGRVNLDFDNYGQLVGVEIIG